MSDTRPVFVMVTAQNCGYCKALHERWAPIQKALLALGTVRIKELNIPDMRYSKVYEQGYPVDMQRYVSWYPTALLFPGDNWNEVMSKKATTLRGRIMNGKVEAPGRPVSDQYSITADGITSWIKDTLADPTFLVGGESKSPPPTPENRNIQTTGSVELCRKMNIKSRKRFR